MTGRRRGLQAVNGAARHYVAVLQARQASPDLGVDQESIVSDCVAKVLQVAGVRPRVDVFLVGSAADVFVSIELMTAIETAMANRALDAACEHVINHCARYGLVGVQRTARASMTNVMQLDVPSVDYVRRPGTVPFRQLWRWCQMLVVPTPVGVDREVHA